MPTLDSFDNDLLPSRRESLFLSENPAILATDLADGTNVVSGTNFICRTTVRQHDLRLNEYTEGAGWKERAERILREFRELRERSSPVGAVCSEKRIPAFANNGTPPELSRRGSLIASGGSTHTEPSFLLERDGQAVRSGLFCVLDARGVPMSSKVGAPLALRFGSFRHFTLIELPRSVHDERPMRMERLHELCSEAGGLLVSLPSDAIHEIFHRHGQFVPLPEEDEYRWIQAVFEHRWTTRRHKKPLSRKVYSDSGYGSIVLVGDGLFPRVPSMDVAGQLIAHAFPTEGGYPFNWSSQLDNVASESIDLLEWILAASWKPAAGLLQHSASPPTMSDSTLKILVSHSSRDLQIVEKVVDLLTSALRLTSSEIRCTSLAGHKLAGGAQTDEALRREVRETPLLLAIVSPSFLESFYAVFELGGRWATNRPLKVLATPRIDFKSISAPLTGLNFLSFENADLHQLLNEIAEMLGLRKEEPHCYQRQLDAVLQAAAGPGVTANTGVSNTQGENGNSSGKLPDDQLDVLLILLANDGGMMWAQLREKLAERGVSGQMAEHLCEELEDRSFVTYTHILDAGGGTRIMISRNGRRYLASQQLLT